MTDIYFTKTSGAKVALFPHSFCHDPVDGNLKTIKYKNLMFVKRAW
jgi:hypothetical protein